MQFTNNEIATYLFCAQLTQTRTKALTILEWNAIVKSLSQQKLEPEVLLTINSTELLNVLTHATEVQKSKISEKIQARQKLGFSMIELKDIINQGFGIMFRSNMPPRLKKLTTKYTPAFFYYAGEPSILSHRSLGVVGARAATEQELTQTFDIGSEAASYGIVIISGGAKGVDTTGVEATLQNGGKAIVFPADGLMKWVKKSNIRSYITNGQLLLMSAQRLDAPFSGAYAMQRNKFIHAPSDAVLVASSKISGKKKSGTWEGVLENIKHQWSPLYVIGCSEGVEKLKAQGNAELFSSFDKVFTRNERSEPKKRTESNEIDERIISLIKLAIAKGLDRETIEEKFVDFSTRYYEKQKQIEQDNTQNLVVHEQLSMEEYMRGKVD
ncbi:DNA-processing protein DprA [Aquibacillus salsiterrae]|uniref:DNA-processing protein DprA n=1 Tax=Aquibacillus salsiterrae TaxID=2950439 RepID=A0A9X3WGN8_9BACI|nr:DNA-processing protein DprA [Aquibacillus salsiterrae]MDC3418086.1 DNA-processing protein DprA [Aquibacillus salsiterrae]